jgi:sec-independent protein translocase protein TatA
MFGLGWPEIVVIGVVGVAVFGSKRIPDLGRSIGQTIRGFREELSTTSEDNSGNISVNNAEDKAIKKTANPEVNSEVSKQENS